MKHLRAPFPLILFAAGLLATAVHAQSNAAPPAGSVLLEKGKPVEREIVGGQSHEYHLQLDAGQYLKLQLSERGLSISIACLGPDGQRRLGFRGEVIADASGTYRFVVAVSERQRRPGSYGIGIETVETATPAHHSRLLKSQQDLAPIMVFGFVRRSTRLAPTCRRFRTPQSSAGVSFPAQRLTPPG